MHAYVIQQRAHTSSQDTHAKSSQDLDTIAPTADKTTYRLTPEGLKYAQSGDLWQFGVVSRLSVGGKVIHNEG